MTIVDKTRQKVRENLDNAQVHIRQAAMCGKQWVRTLDGDDDHGLSSVLAEVVSALSQDHLALENLDTLVGVLYIILTDVEESEETWDVE